MKNKVRLSVFSAGVLLVVSTLCLSAFAGIWLYRSIEIRRLADREAHLQEELRSNFRYGKWTLDYCRIYLSLDIVAGKRMTENQKQTLSDEIWMISRNYGFDPLLVPAIVFQESKGNPQARGRFRSGAESGAYGLMQLKIPTAQAIGKRFGLKVESAEDLMKPEVSLITGSAYLMRLIGRYGNLKNAIIAYNIGQGGVDAKIRDRSPLPTFYYEEVLAKYQKLRRLVGERIGNLSSDF